MALCLHVCVHVHKLLSWLYCLTHLNTRLLNHRPSTEVKVHVRLVFS